MRKRMEMRSCAILALTLCLAACEGGSTAVDSGRLDDLGADAGTQPLDLSIPDQGPADPFICVAGSGCSSITSFDTCEASSCRSIGICERNSSLLFCIGRQESSCRRAAQCVWNGICAENNGDPCGTVGASQCEASLCELSSFSCAPNSVACGALGASDCASDPYCRPDCSAGYTFCADGCRLDADAAGDPGCVADCAGIPAGPSTVDRCGVCDDDDSNDCDCAGVPGGTSVVDECGVCDDDPTNQCAVDCNGVDAGPARVDMCGVCDADFSNDCVMDCAGIWGGTATEDDCGVCDTDTTNDCVLDCAGVANGSAALDECFNCDADASNDCVVDCNGEPGGAGVPDGSAGCTDSTPANCPGVWMFGNCWSVGGRAENCDVVCAAQGGTYDESTRYAAGDLGTDERCQAILTALAVSSDEVDARDASGQLGRMGCTARRPNSSTVWDPRRYLQPTTSGASVLNYARACACEYP